MPTSLLSNELPGDCCCWSENHVKYALCSHEHVWAWLFYTVPGTKGWSCSLSQISCFRLRHEALQYWLQLKTVELTLTHHYFHSEFQKLGQGSRKNSFFKKREICQIFLHFGIRNCCFLTTVETVEMTGSDVVFGGKRKSSVTTVSIMLVNFKCPRSHLFLPFASLQESC